jgi:prepilin-type N-terminal cleavage/methylation domain-containing protein
MKRETDAPGVPGEKSGLGAKGFTLLEVVVAMAIVGLGVVTVMEIFSLGLRLGTKSSERTETVAIGRQVFDRILLRTNPGEGFESGSLAQGYQWQLSTSRFKVDGALSLSTPWELKEINLSIRGGDRQVELTTLRLVREEKR